MCDVAEILDPVGSAVYNDDDYYSDPLTHIDPFAKAVDETFDGLNIRDDAAALTETAIRHAADPLDPTWTPQFGGMITDSPEIVNWQGGLSNDTFNEMTQRGGGGPSQDILWGLNKVGDVVAPMFAGNALSSAAGLGNASAVGEVGMTAPEAAGLTGEGMGGVAELGMDGATSFGGGAGAGASSYVDGFDSLGGIEGLDTAYSGMPMTAPEDAMLTSADTVPSYTTQDILNGAMTDGAVMAPEEAQLTGTMQPSTGQKIAQGLDTAKKLYNAGKTASNLYNALNPQEFSTANTNNQLSTLSGLGMNVNKAFGLGGNAGRQVGYLARFKNGGGV